MSQQGGAFLVLRQIPVNIYDFPQLENYLAYMAEHGLFLKKVFGFGIFQRGIGEKAKYHAEFLDGSSGSLDKEKLAPFEEAGWEYICKIDNSLYILKAKSEEAKELTIEPDALKENLIKAKKKNRNILLCLILYFLILSFIVYDAPLFEFPAYYAIEDSGILYILFLLIMWIFAVILEYKNIKNIRHCLKFGCDYSQKDTYPTQYRRVLTNIAFMLLWIFMISIYIYSHLAGWEKPLVEYQGKHPAISLSTIETNPHLQLEDKDTPEEIRHSIIKYRWTELAPEIYEVEESGQIEGKEKSMELDTDYYTLRFQFLVDPFINDYMKYKKSFYYMKDIEWESIENTKFDQAYYCHSGYYQGFFASVDNKVICVQYYSDEDLSDFEDKNLSKFGDEIYQSIIQFEYSK